MSTLSVKILNPKARNILDDLANVGLIEVRPSTSAMAEFQKEMSGVAEKCGIQSEHDVTQIVADIRREIRNESMLPRRSAI
ncbi:MAG: hypothetical protein LBI05_05070 [Planctomycetaceae bacterium]|jgi:hypothetical protein|nr:hypothetical protein [Planctomycetaceae bacterium]